MAIHEMFTYIRVKSAGKAIDFYKARSALPRSSA
jgi:hypothetical protein